MHPFLSITLLFGSALMVPSPHEDREVLAMGTRFSLHLEGNGRTAEPLLAEIARIETACSTWRRESVWSRLNTADGEAVSMEAEWLQLLSRVQAWSRETSGAFDPVLMSLVQTWGLRVGGRMPSPEERTKALAHCGSNLLRLDARAGTARLSDPLAGLEEGGFLKGYALDAAKRTAEAQGASSGWLNFGGQILTWGRPSEVQIAHSRHRHRPALRMFLVNASLSSSGYSERGPHILDPRTGEPCPDWGTVSVVCPSALDADVLSTALFVMGPVQGFAWAQSRRLPAVFQPHDGPVLMTGAFQNLHPTLF